MKSMLRVALSAISLISITPCFAGLILLSETRSVTASYFGNGEETISSAGAFGAFEATAIGTPFGGGSMSAFQKSDITPSGFTLQHSVADFFGPGGWAKSSFEVNFSLVEDTRITISGYCNMFSGFASLNSASVGSIPLVWTGPSGNTADPYRNYLEFDQVLGPGIYTFSSYEIPREVVTTRLALHASPVPDGGSSAVLVAIAALMLAAIRWRVAMITLHGKLVH